MTPQTAVSPHPADSPHPASGVTSSREAAPPVVRAQGLTRSFPRGMALDGVDLNCAPDRIHGLIGRNGAGKTTLLSMIAGQVRPSAGALEVFGQMPAENPRVISRTVFIRDHQTYAEDLRVEHVLKTSALIHPRWDERFARELLAEFGLNPRAKAKKLSTGQRTALGLVAGLASRAELTLLDEPYSGLDPVARSLFYDRLLEDFTAHPRTIILSTHLIDEVEHLLNEVILLEQGRVRFQGSAEDLGTRAFRVGGPGEAVDELIARLDRQAPGEYALVRRDAVGVTALASIDGPREDAEPMARELGLEVEAVGLQDAMTILSRAGRRPGTAREGATS